MYQQKTLHEEPLTPSHLMTEQRVLNLSNRKVIKVTHICKKNVVSVTRVKPKSYH